MRKADRECRIRKFQVNPRSPSKAPLLWPRTDGLTMQEARTAASNGIFHSAGRLSYWESAALLFGVAWPLFLPE